MAHPRQTARFFPIIIILVTAAAFWPAVTCGFVDWDDQFTVAGNARQNPTSAASVVRYWQRPAMDIYIPLTYTVWSILAAGAQVARADEAGWRLNPYVFHFANLTFHVLAVNANPTTHPSDIAAETM